MAAPVLPSDFKKLIVEPDDTLATAIIKVFVRLPVLLYKLAKYMWKNDGELGDDFAKDLCALGCGGSSNQST